MLMILRMPLVELLLGAHFRFVIDDSRSGIRRSGGVVDAFRRKPALPPIQDHKSRIHNANLRVRLTVGGFQFPTKAVILAAQQSAAARGDSPQVL